MEQERESGGGGCVCVWGGSRWWGPGEHFIFLIDNNGFINEQSFHTPHTVHHGLEFCGRAREREKQWLQKREKFQFKHSTSESLLLANPGCRVFYTFFRNENPFSSGGHVSQPIFWPDRGVVLSHTQVCSRKGINDMSYSRLSYTFCHYPG